MSVCRCGHEDREHFGGGLICAGDMAPEEWGDLTIRPACPCRRFDGGVLPEPGERPVFGVHRLNSAEANWTTEGEAERERKFREWVKGAPKDIA
jgi:hypothetical protein